jgi:lysyl-tRNA synthetase class 2
MMAKERVILDSSMLASVSYDDEQQVLDVEFRGGRRYRYFEVPEIVYAGLMKATSKGLFFNDRIRDAFYSQRL